MMIKSTILAGVAYFLRLMALYFGIALIGILLVVIPALAQMIIDVPMPLIYIFEAVIAGAAIHVLATSTLSKVYANNKARNATKSKHLDDAPPKTPAYLLYLLLPKKQRNLLLGDLEEEYIEVYDRFGRNLAQAWFWKQTIASLLPLFYMWLGRSDFRIKSVASQELSEDTEASAIVYSHFIRRLDRT